MTGKDAQWGETWPGMFDKSRKDVPREWEKEKQTKRALSSTNTALTRVWKSICKSGCLFITIEDCRKQCKTEKVKKRERNRAVVLFGKCYLAQNRREEELVLFMWGKESKEDAHINGQRETRRQAASLQNKVSIGLSKNSNFSGNREHKITSAKHTQVCPPATFFSSQAECPKHKKKKKKNSETKTFVPGHQPRRLPP